MIRVAVAARSAVARAGLEALLSGDPQLEIVERLPGLAGIVAVEADVVLASGTEMAGTGPPLVLLVEEADPEFTAGALRAGARAVLSPETPAEEVRAAVYAAAAGLVALRPADLEMLLPAPVLEEDRGGQPLSPRELEILRMLAEGMANKTIAWKLGISEHTVKFHVASILNRLNATSRTEAVTLGIRRGLILI